MTKTIDSSYKLPLRVLVVDDDEEYRAHIVPMLEDIGFAVDTAEDSLQAKAMFDKNPYHLFLLDQTMPDFSGRENDEAAVELGLHIKKHLPHAFIMVITGLAGFDPLKRATSSSACDDYVEKYPVQIKKGYLKQMIDDAMARRLVPLQPWGDTEYQIDPIDFIGRTAVVENRISVDNDEQGMGVVKLFDISWKAFPHKPGKLHGHVMKKGDEVLVKDVDNGFLYVHPKRILY